MAATPSPAAACWCRVPVGALLIDHLLDLGAKVLFTDVDRAVVERLRNGRGLTYVAPEAVYTTPCDVFSPCATGGVLDPTTIAALRCRVIAGAANNQLASPPAAALLRERSILYAPDFAINAGGAVAVVGIEALGWSRAEAEAQVRRIGDTLSEIFTLSSQSGIDTDTAARRLAERRLGALPVGRDDKSPTRAGA